MLFDRIRCNYYLAGIKSKLILTVIGSEIIVFILFSNAIYGSEEGGSSDDIDEDLIFATLLADENALQEIIPDMNTQGGKILRFGVADVTGDGNNDLIITEDEPGSKQNGDTYFCTVKSGKPRLIGALKPDPLQKVGYHADSGYVYLYTEEENGGQKRP